MYTLHRCDTPPGMRWAVWHAQLGIIAYFVIELDAIAFVNLMNGVES